MNGTSFDFDLISIGSGPGGQRAAIQAAKLGKKVAVIERTTGVGGVCVRTGTIPSKTLREAAMALTGYRDRGFYGSSYTVKQHIGMEDLIFRADQVVRNEIDVVRHQLLRNDIDIYNGHGAFLDPHTIEIADPDGHGRQTITGAHIVLATGTTATRDESVEFDGRRILTSDDVVTLDRLPRTLVGDRRRGHRARVREHVLRAGRAGDAGRQAAAAAVVHGLRDHGRAGVPHAPRPRDAAGWARRSARSSSTTGTTARCGCTWPAASTSSPRRRSTRSAAPGRPGASTSPRRGSPPTTAAG